MRMTKLPSGDEIVVLGMGTRHMGEAPSRRGEEIAAPGPETGNDADRHRRDVRRRQG